ncbi:hypothetical protein FSARC_3270 [Fusarium sarcochroum]|uniref:Uncharacterized protein n=1 Tax=Fusarium sarcochroum TaxID=1208366 RepID=A0A8H4XCT8_9HYPO|nr:hypothetical protein FSARC_3270 [Fusarium sarcochroum]
MTSNDLPLTLQMARSSAPRRRTGCQTCRSKGQLARSSATTQLSISSYAIPFKVPGSQNDRRLLHYFCVQGSSDISGFLTSDFWSQTVLRESHQDQVIRQALVAMSSLHLNYITSNSEEGLVRNVDTLTQYGKALRAVRRRLGQPTNATLKTVLVCCIIFYCCESALGDRDAALQHLSNGVKMLASAQHEQAGKESDDMKKLSAIFERLDMQASFFEDDRSPLLTFSPWKSVVTRDDPLLHEESFSRLQDAQESLIRLQAWLYHFVNEYAHLHEEPKEALPSYVLQERDALVQGYTAWGKALNDFWVGAQHDQRNLYGYRTLLVQFHVCRMILESKFPKNDDIFDVSPNLDVQMILDLAESLLQHTVEKNASTNATKSPRRNFSLETGIVAPVFALAIKCSDEAIITRAAQMLASSQRREGLYDAQVMAQIVTQLKTLREKGVPCERALNINGT